ncbi:MAG: SGNH/GDSL hydrolase family protein [Nocardioides sp.]|nr:SGNH/GDSL hydrolase family protein [Nocardioides sp.]
MSSAAERARLAGLVLLTIATIAVIAFEFTRDSRDSREADGPDPVASPTSEPTMTSPPDPPLSVPADADVLFIGDDWVAGEGASAPSGGFAHRTAKRLGWDYRIDAVPGSGWAHAAPDVPGSMFLDRVIRMRSTEFTPDLVVISAQMASPAMPAEVRRLMRQTVSVLLDRTPDSVVALVLPHGNPRALGWCAPLESARVLCIDPAGERWLPEGDRAAYLGSDGLVPNNAGHERLAELLVADLRRDLTFL